MKSIIEFFADLNIEIKDIDYTTKPVQYEKKNTDNYKKLPKSIRNYIKEDPDSSVFQYVFKTQINKTNKLEILEANWKVYKEKQPSFIKSNNKSKLAKTKLVIEALFY